MSNSDNDVIWPWEDDSEFQDQSTASSGESNASASAMNAPTSSDAPHKHTGKSKSAIPFKIATAILAVTTITFGAFSFIKSHQVQELTQDNQGMRPQAEQADELSVSTESMSGEISTLSSEVSRLSGESSSLEARVSSAESSLSQATSPSSGVEDAIRCSESTEAQAIFQGSGGAECNFIALVGDELAGRPFSADRTFEVWSPNLRADVRVTCSEEEDIRGEQLWNCRTEHGSRLYVYP